MRVTFILPQLDMTGGNRIISVYARMLRDAGHVVVVVVAGPRRQSLKSRLRNILIGGFESLRLHASPSHFDGLDLDVRHMDSYRPATDADVPDADIVIATWWETAEWVMDMSAGKGRKVYLVQHHEVFSGQPVERVRATYRLPFHKIVVAEWLRELMRDEYHDHNVDVVTNAVDKMQFYSPPRSKQRRPTLAFMSSLAEFKGGHVAVSAINEIKRLVPALKVISFGHERISGLDELGSDLEFYFRPTQERIRECYAQSDVWLSSSRSEGFNLPALEAMACRTPVVSTRTGWPASAVVDGVNGFLADVDDWRGLAEGAIHILRSDMVTWSALSQGAYETARPLTWDRVYPALENALLRASRH